jgi:hypothetical protein
MGAVNIHNTCNGRCRGSHGWQVNIVKEEYSACRENEAKLPDMFGWTGSQDLSFRRLTLSVNEQSPAVHFLTFLLGLS